MSWKAYRPGAAFWPDLLCLSKLNDRLSPTVASVRLPPVSADLPTLTTQLDMAFLYNKETGDQLGVISPAQLHFLNEQLEEESLTDRDYYMDRATIDLLREAGADDELVALLEQALGDKEGIEVRWT